MRHIHFLTIFFAVLMSTSAVLAAPLIAVDRGDGVLVDKESGKIIGKINPGHPTGQIIRVDAGNYAVGFVSSLLFEPVEKKDVPVPAYNRDAMERVTTFLTTGRKDPLRLFISCTEMKEEFYNRVMRGAETEYIDTRLEKASRDAGKTMPRRVDFPTVGDGSRLYTVTDMMNGIKMHTDILYIVKAPVIWAVEFDYPEDVPGLGARVREALEDVQAWTTGEPGK